MRGHVFVKICLCRELDLGQEFVCSTQAGSHEEEEPQEEEAESASNGREQNSRGNCQKFPEKVTEGELSCFFPHSPNMFEFIIRDF